MILKMSQNCCDYNYSFPNAVNTLSTKRPRHIENTDHEDFILYDKEDRSVIKKKLNAENFVLNNDILKGKTLIKIWMIFNFLLKTYPQCHYQVWQNVKH